MISYDGIVGQGVFPITVTSDVPASSPAESVTLIVQAVALGYPNAILDDSAEPLASYYANGCYGFDNPWIDLFRVASIIGGGLPPIWFPTFADAGIGWQHVLQAATVIKPLPIGTTISASSMVPPGDVNPEIVNNSSYMWGVVRQFRGMDGDPMHRIVNPFVDPVEVLNLTSAIFYPAMTVNGPGFTETGVGGVNNFNQAEDSDAFPDDGLVLATVANSGSTAFAVPLSLTDARRQTQDTLSCDASAACEPFASEDWLGTYNGGTSDLASYLDSVVGDTRSYQLDLDVTFASTLHYTRTQTEIWDMGIKLANATDVISFQTDWNNATPPFGYTLVDCGDTPCPATFDITHDFNEPTLSYFPVAILTGQIGPPRCGLDISNRFGIGSSIASGATGARPLVSIAEHIPLGSTVASHATGMTGITVQRRIGRA